MQRKLTIGGLAASVLTAAWLFSTPAPAPTQTSLRTHDGVHVLTAELDDTVVATRTEPAAWETWQVEQVEGGVALKSAHGRYLAAEPDGSVVANREVAAAWETWRVVPSGAGVGLQSAHGGFLVAEGGGGSLVRADRYYDAPGPWETFATSAPIDDGGDDGPPASRLIGRLRIEAGTTYRDDTGPVRPTYAHAGDLFSVWVRDRGRAITELDRIASAGYHGARVWLTLGCGPDTAAGCPSGAFWRGREVGPDVTPAYWQALRDFRDAFSARGLRLVASQGDIGQLRDRRAYMEALRRVYDEAPVLDWLDCGNEAWQTGEPDPAKLAQCVGYFGGGAALRTLTDAPIYNSATPGHELLNQFSIPPADAFDIHSYRGGHSWDKRRHIWGYTYCGEGCPTLQVGIGSEGPGNGWRVSAIANRHELDDEAMALLALASHLGRQAFVWFSGQGVILEGGLHEEAGFWSVPAAVARLPRDVYTFRTSHHSGESFRAVRVLEPQGEVRIDGRMAEDGRFAYTIDGPGGTYALRVARGFDGQLCDPGTDVCEDVSAPTGSALRVSFTRGRLLVGRVH